MLLDVEIGLDARKFLDSRLGKTIIAAAEAQRDDAIAGLKTVDAENPKAVRELQNQLWRAEQFQFWLADLIQAGINAEAQLAEYQSDDNH